MLFANIFKIINKMSFKLHNDFKCYYMYLIPPNIHSIGYSFFLSLIFILMEVARLFMETTIY